jgi:5'-nucleotidase
MEERLILLTNDDGVLSEGVNTLKAALTDLGRVVIVSPSEERSGGSHALTMKTPVRIKEIEKDIYSLTGFPSDCIYAAVHGILKRKPDLVVSGINRGANMGIDVYYSGTLAGVRQAAIEGVKGFAISVNIDKNPDRIYWETASDFAFKVASEMLEKGYKKSGFLNINCPNVDKEHIKGVRITKMGDRRYVTEVKWGDDPRGERYCWLWGEYTEFGSIEDSDCDAVSEGFISVTPMMLDVTDYSMINELKGWKFE